MYPCPKCPNQQFEKSSVMSTFNKWHIWNVSLTNFQLGAVSNERWESPKRMIWKVAGAVRSAAHVNWRDRQKMKPARPLFLISNETDWVWRRAEWWDQEQIAALLTIQSGLTQCDRAPIYFCKRHPIRQSINTFHHNFIGWWMIGNGSWFQFWGRFQMPQEFNIGHVQSKWVGEPE